MRRGGDPTAALVLLVTARAGASATKVFRQTSAKDFEEGEATGSMILPTGEVVPGMRTTPRGARRRVRLVRGAASRDGRAAYFGTGDEGRIFAVDAKSAPATSEPARKVADLDAAWVTALAARPDGTLLAGTTPGGRIFTVDPKTRQRARTGHAGGRPRLEPGATTRKTGVDLRRDRRRPGRSSPIDATRARARALGFGRQARRVAGAGADGAARLLAGTSEEAILYRVGAGRARRGAAGLRGRGGARASPRAGDAHLRRGQRLREAPPRTTPPGRRGRQGDAGSCSRAVGSPASAGSAAAPRAAQGQGRRSTASSATAASSRSSRSPTAT